jgi:HAMP domain-containing protein
MSFNLKKYFKFISLRWKIAGILVFSNLILGSIVVYIVNTKFSSTLEKELIERGKSIAKNISIYSTPQILSKDEIGLKDVITKLISFEAVQYILIHDNDASIIADTYNRQVPIELTDRSLYAGINVTKPQIIKISSQDVECYDIIEPVEEGYVGYVRVGMLKSYIQEKIKATTTTIIFVVIIITLLGIVLVYFVANRIIKPILYLANCANEISRGKLEDKVQVKTNDEILYLSEAIERLRESLNMALERLEKHKTSRI